MVVLTRHNKTACTLINKLTCCVDWHLIAENTECKTGSDNLLFHLLELEEERERERGFPVGMDDDREDVVVSKDATLRSFGLSG